MTPNQSLRYRVTGAIERGEAEPIQGLPADRFTETGEPFEPTVMLHGFHKLPGGYEEHCDFDDVDCVNWNVWLRRDYTARDADAIEPFDSDDSRDRDFKSLADAVAYAVQLADEFHTEIDEY